MIRLVKAEVDKIEKGHESWIIQGFPRTKVQALSLQQLRIIPDKFIHLNIRQGQSISKIQQNIQLIKPTCYGQELQEAAVQVSNEYEMNMRAVRNSFKQFIFEYDADRPHPDISADLFKMLKLRFQNGAPRRPPKIILLGPPGSGRSMQSGILAETFGIVHVSPEELLKAEAEKNPGVKLKIRGSVESGDSIPDEIILRLIDSRLRQSDCRVNGWVLDGFP